MHGGAVSVIDLLRIVAAAPQALDLSVREVLDEREEGGGFAEEVVACVGAGFDGVFLVLPIDDFAHATHELAFRILPEERIPVASPDHLDDVPASAAEGCFQLLDDLAVTAYWAVESLQVAVDDEGEVVELLP